MIWRVAPLPSSDTQLTEDAFSSIVSDPCAIALWGSSGLSSGRCCCSIAGAFRLSSSPPSVPAAVQRTNVDASRIASAPAAAIAMTLPFVLLSFGFMSVSFLAHVPEGAGEAFYSR